VDLNKLKSAFAITFLACIAGNAASFEVRTHGILTREAWSRFTFENPDILERLGIKNVDDPFATTRYFDFRPAQEEAPRVRETHAFENGMMRETALGVNDLHSVRGWLSRGTIRGDDDIDASDPSPKEDSYGEFHRVFSHFLDPVNGNRGLTVPFLGAIGAPAVDWALNPNAVTPAWPPVPLPVTPTPARFNHFGLSTFRESLWRALTGLNQAGQVVAGTAAERNQYWTTAFRSLGNILHLNQDMAQPQHTRNDRHAGGGFPQELVAGHKSVFERYVDARMRGLGGFSTRDDANAPNVTIVARQFTSFGSYPTPNFTRFADYWTSEDNKGLANYTNAGFFSSGTLPGRTTYPSPSADIGSYGQPEIVPTTRWDGTPTAMPPTELYIGQVQDANLETSTPGVKIFARSAWDEAAQGLQLPVARVMLTRHNYDDAMALLIPRAVAYSAGILQYAFRGKLDLTPPDDGAYSIVDHTQVNQSDPLNGFAGFSKIKVKVRNATQGENMTNGRLVLIAKFRRNPCYRGDLTGEFDEEHVNPDGSYFIPGCNAQDFPTPDEESAMSDLVTSDPIEGGPITLNAGAAPTQMVFNFTQRQIPVNATDLKLQIVFRGQLGEEQDAVAVSTKDISEPTYLSILNSTDYFIWQNGYYTQANAPAGIPRDENGQLPETSNPVPRTFKLYLDPNTNIDNPTATAESLAPGHHVRLAVLSNVPTYYARALVFRPGETSPVSGMGGAGWNAAYNQLDGDTYFFSPLGVFRGVRYFSLMWYLRSVDGSPGGEDTSAITNPAHATPDAAASLNF
jgi:hypothetical protein